ncbi:hypothetical protein A2572_00810 [Candidatus Collierbacteria bacterium RIFOXYD1_FULL_40_9]|uniref:Nucleotidyl transferase AbiEii/AbiGii toxin family protein n=1 Tax=Candidatus Collierbacteria bacterium RIFOXYD1_FULL_40_9 TaxID=1817731 RepID=A0A1F5FVU9_9BACT|nr:MAG: hypothetical protein A2572_00810 [Candidatus Collierbacteria bacterium RIFOXYD1_FULL_40_9]
MEKQVLTDFQKKLLFYFEKNEYLRDKLFFTGGTALSHYYFQHRFSEDLDFFAEEEFDQLQILAWIKSISPELKIKEIEQQILNGQLTLFLYYTEEEKPLKLDFAYFPFPHMGKFEMLGKIRVSSLEDIAVNKIQAITTRSRSRDYFDLKLCLEKLGWSDEVVRQKYRTKFEVSLPPESLATAYTNVQTAKDLPIFLGEVDWGGTEKYFLDRALGLKSLILE